MQRILYAILSLLTVPFASIMLRAQGSVQMQIEPVFNGRPLCLDSMAYINEHGDTLTISLLSFYISSLKLSGSSGTMEENGVYHLVSTEDSGSNIFIINNVPQGSYNVISFIAGVDSLANVSGALGGDLDPAKGMYWAWNTGYIMAKLEGNSKACKTLHHAFEFHIGGYLPPYQAARGVAIPCTKSIVVMDRQQAIVHIKADIAAWFRGKKLIDLSRTNSVLIPGKDAMDIADNYQKMFAFSDVLNP